MLEVGYVDLRDLTFRKTNLTAQRIATTTNIGFLVRL